MKLSKLRAAESEARAYGERYHNASLEIERLVKENLQQAVAIKDQRRVLELMQPAARQAVTHLDEFRDYMRRMKDETANTTQRLALQKLQEIAYSASAALQNVINEASK